MMPYHIKEAMIAPTNSPSNPTTHRMATKYDTTLNLSQKEYTIEDTVQKTHNHAHTGNLYISVSLTPSHEIMLEIRLQLT